MIKPGGNGDVYSGPDLEARIGELIDSGKRHILIDLSEGTYIDDSSIVGVLTEAVRSAGGSVALVCADDSMRKVFEITGLDRVLQIYSSRVEALAAGRADA